MDPVCCATLVLVGFEFLMLCVIGAHGESTEKKIDLVEERLTAILAKLDGLADDKEVGLYEDGRQAGMLASANLILKNLDAKPYP